MAEQITSEGMDITRLVENMRNNGWVGGPILIDGGYDDILDGNHRYAAAKHLGWADNDIPALDVYDWCDEFGFDLYEYTDDVERGSARYTMRLDDMLQYMPAEAFEAYNLFEGNF